MTSNKLPPLDFELPLSNLNTQIEALERQLPNNPQLEQEINELYKQYESLKKTIYGNLRAIDRLAIARHPNRPYTRDYLERFDPNWLELHGDRHGVDDMAMVCGLVKLDNYKVVVVGTQKGRNIREKQLCNFGMPQPEGYRKALRCFKHAQKFNLPILTLIDTPGAYPGMAAEEHNQAQAIAFNLFELADLTVPVISVILGEGGSGGALAIGFTNTILMLARDQDYETALETLDSIPKEANQYKLAQILKTKYLTLLQNADGQDQGKSSGKKNKR